MNTRLLLTFCLLVPTAAAQWSVPVPVQNVNSFESDFDPCPAMLGRTLYFCSNRTGNFELFRAVRTGTGAYGPFGAPTQITELSDPGTDAGPCVRIDEREIFFYSARAGGFDLWRAERGSASGPFNPPTPVSELNTFYAETSPSITADGLQIFFASNRYGGTGGFDIWTATRPNWSTPFGTPVPVTVVNSQAREDDPHIAPDGLTIFFASNRVGTLGRGDIWMASRLDPASPFGAPVNVLALNSFYDDAAPAFGLFADEIFFTSTRAGGLGGYDIHSARFTGLVSVGFTGPSAIQELLFSDPSSPRLPYVAAASLGSSPGIPIDVRVLPLNFDALFQISLGGLQPFLIGFAGLLDQDGVAPGRISFLGFPQFVGLRFFTAFIVLDATAPSSVKTISNAHEVKVQ